MAVTRSKDVPPFGPPIPRGATFRRSELFRDFLLAKAVNAEHAAHKSAKFKAMATRTRQEYLRDLAERCGTGPPLDAAGKFSLMALASKRREKARARAGAELLSAGALAWHVRARDFGRSAEVDCALAVSSELMALLDLAAKEVAFHCFCADVIGWTADAATLKVFYGRGDHVLLRAPDESPGDIQEIVQRLKVRAGVRVTLRGGGLCGSVVPRHAYVGSGSHVAACTPSASGVNESGQSRERRGWGCLVCSGHCAPLPPPKPR